MKKLFRVIAIALSATVLMAGSVLALDYDFAGTFAKDNDVLQFNFTVGETSNVTVFSSSWISGGFDPILAIWTSGGSKLYEQDDGGLIGSALSNGVSYNYGGWDSYYTLNLSAGSYIATVAQFSNFSQSNNLADGFVYDSDPHFTRTLGYGTQEYFNGVLNFNDARTGNWAFHLLNVAEADVIDPNNPVPEPSTFILFGAGLGGFAFYRRRSKK